MTADARTQRLRALLEKWRTKYPAQTVYKQSADDYWAGQCSGVNRCADELRAVLDTEGDRPTPQTKNTDDGLCQGTINGYVVCELPRGHEGPHGHAPALPDPPVQP